jgi:hypothetical protein
MSRPSHMQGIDSAVPKWDRSNPTKYSYDPMNYSASDYAEFSQARLDAQTKQQKKTAADAKRIAKENEKWLNDFLNKEAKKLQTNKDKVDRDQVEAWVKAGYTLYADIPSSCFEELKFIPDKDDPSTGTMVGTFYHGGSLTYSGEADLFDFLDAVEGGSLGEAYAAGKWF